MTYEVQQTRWDRLIRRVSGSIGPGSRVSETLSELFPILDVETEIGELQILGGTRICFGGATVPATAGEVPHAQLFNPVASGVIATVTSFWASGSPSNLVRWGRTQTQDGALTGSETFRDTRMPVTTNPVCQLSQLSDPAVAGGTGRINVENLFPLHITDPNSVMVLSPGNGLEVGLGIVGSAFEFTVFWRERPATEAELQF